MTSAKLLMVIGLGVFVLGLLLHVSPRLFAWFGKLPGDIRVEGEHGSVFFPITSMIVISVVLSVLFSLFSRK